LLTITAGGAAAGCIGDDLHEDRIANARIERNLQADGCEMLVTIEDAQYSPDNASRCAITARQLPSFAEVTIKYHLTGDTGVVRCGFGAHLTLLQIGFEFVDLE